VRALHLSAAEERLVLGGTILRLMRPVRTPQVAPRVVAVAGQVSAAAGDPWLNE
jgi:hypothetical protein